MTSEVTLVTFEDTLMSSDDAVMTLKVTEATLYIIPVFKAILIMAILIIDQGKIIKCAVITIYTKSVLLERN